MNTAAKTVAALLFVALLGGVLTIPLRDSDGSPPRRATVARPTPARSPTETRHARREPTGPLRTKRFVQRFPRACLRPVARPDDGGLIAALNGRRVTIVTSSGESRATITDVAPVVRPPLAWSPSGRYIAVGPQGLFWTAEGEVVLFANGEFSHGMVQGSTGPWAWSPISDCGVAIEDDFEGALQVNHIDPHLAANIRLVNKGVESFAYSPDGRTLGLVIAERGIRSLWFADLDASRLHEVKRFDSGICCVNLGGWTPDGSALLYWAGPGASVMADGWPLRSIDRTGEVARWGRTLTRPDILVGCSETLYAIDRRDRLDAEGQLRALPSDTPLSTQEVSAASCNVRGRIVASARIDGSARSQLVLLDGDGGQVVTSDPDYSDQRPQWASGIGVLFERLPIIERCEHDTPECAAQVWFIPEGGTPRSLGLRLNREDYGLRAIVDWSATPPNGLPVS
ncbi:MAG TPA: hypothetical protein VG408_10085 [Actinomycetota bacterium]|nr:hypothetical protein [Actinomycetota bacterium]